MVERPPQTFPGTADGPIPKISRATLYGLARQAPAAGREKVTRLRGVVRCGVERTSRVLIGPGGEVLAQLMGGPPAVIADGCAVVVTGVFVRDLVTTVQQGAPFRVDAAERDAGPRAAPTQ